MSSTHRKVLPSEFYPTPDAVVDTLIRHLNLKPEDQFLEPCRGDGAIFDKVPLPEQQKAYAEIREGIDYLNTSFSPKDVIITNPPFSLTVEFIRKSLSELTDDGTMIYLQRLNFLGSKTRIPFWQEVGLPDKVSIIVPRPRFVKNASDSCEYCWFIWDRGDRLTLPKGISHLVTQIQ
ncbi:adenine-specific methyltransferase EcoRI family protein [Pleionea sp. CnH1-48]|uniref:adenine-specific methyltransferase EcoRI family protein n=1 Tax=Pleionea sp. CnH1-48 TaxID=2954494 RepID=UPI0020984092|nr:adenine-specific methyltransferase EcoRI family protein [Pleionea sp. CnH1-48]MCO7225342.1 adenine-specific methyltransferase EcoRI family protein [Pleionea sp. CnH1-48]